MSTIIVNTKLAAEASLIFAMFAQQIKSKIERFPFETTAPVTLQSLGFCPYNVKNDNGVDDSVFNFFHDLYQSGINHAPECLTFEEFTRIVNDLFKRCIEKLNIELLKILNKDIANERETCEISLALFAKDRTKSKYHETIYIDFYKRFINRVSEKYNDRLKSFREVLDGVIDRETGSMPFFESTVVNHPSPSHQESIFDDDEEEKEIQSDTKEKGEKSKEKTIRNKPKSMSYREIFNEKARISNKKKFKKNAKIAKKRHNKLRRRRSTGRFSSFIKKNQQKKIVK